MLANLIQDKFTGNVQIKLGNDLGFFIMGNGVILRALEGTSRGTLTARLPARIYALLRQRPIAEVSSFVLSEAMVSVMASSFAFTAFMPEKRIERRELKSVISNIESNRLTGFIRVVGPSGFIYLVLNEGEILTERFADRYGEIICGQGQVRSVLDYVHEQGSRIMIKAEKPEMINRKVEDATLDLSRIKMLTLKKTSSLFRSAEEVKLSEDIFRDWGVDTKAVFDVELETADGRLYTYRCRSGNTRIGQRLEVHSNMLKDMNVNEGDSVNVRPILS